jgi:hypothetical protein
MQTLIHKVNKGFPCQENTLITFSNLRQYFCKNFVSTLIIHIGDY